MSDGLARYVVCYRGLSVRAAPALIVSDQQGSAYLFKANRLRCRLSGPDAPERLARLLASRRTWIPVPVVSPYTLGELHRLVRGDRPGRGASAVGVAVMVAGRSWISGMGKDGR